MEETRAGVQVVQPASAASGPVGPSTSPKAPEPRPPQTPGPTVTNTENRGHASTLPRVEAESQPIGNTTNVEKTARSIPKFTKTKPSPLGPQTAVALGVGTPSDTALGKRPRAEAGLDSMSETEQEIEMGARSSYTPSPTASTAAATTTALPNVAMPSEEDKKATELFLARLRAKDEATAMSLDPNPPAMHIATTQYTPKPEGGFPVVYGRNPTHAFDNIDLTQITAWMDLEGPLVFVQPLFHGFYPSAIAQEIVGILQSTIKDLFGCEKPKVAAPMASSTPPTVDHAPYTYLLRNIPPEVAAKLIDQRCWATEKIGFLVYTAEAITPTYLGAIEGLNPTDDDDVMEVKALIARTLAQGEVGAIIAEISTCDPDLVGLGAPERVDKIVKTLRINVISIRASRGSLRPIINMYLDCPFGSDMDWNRLLDAVTKTKFRHVLLGIGNILRGWTCTICHGADHPSGLCPLPSVPGWIKAIPIAPIVEHRNQIVQQPRAPESHRGRGGGNRRGRGNTTRSRGSDNRPRGS
jgi:hypothetical protein